MDRTEVGTPGEAEPGEEAELGSMEVAVEMMMEEVEERHPSRVAEEVVVATSWLHVTVELAIVTKLIAG